LIVAELNDILKEALESAQTDDYNGSSDDDDEEDGEWEDDVGQRDSNNQSGSRLDMELSKMLDGTPGMSN
jgi:hypothetical protein